MVGWEIRLVWLLKDIYLKHAKNFDNNEKIYIDRTDSKFRHCQIQNDEEVFGFLKEIGFSKYKIGFSGTINIDITEFDNNFNFKVGQLYNKKGFRGLHGEFFIENNLSKQKLKIYKISQKKFIEVY